MSSAALRVVAFAPGQCGGTRDSVSNATHRASPVPATPPPTLLLTNAGRDLDDAHDGDGGGDDNNCDSGTGASRSPL